MSVFKSLHPDLFYEILKLLDLDSLLEFKYTNKYFCEFCKNLQIYFPDVVVSDVSMLLEQFPRTKSLYIDSDEEFKASELEQFRLKYFKYNESISLEHLKVLERFSPNLEILKIDCDDSSYSLNFPNLRELSINCCTPLFFNLFNNIEYLSLSVRENKCFEIFMNCSFPKLKNLILYTLGPDFPGNLFQNVPNIEELELYLWDSDIDSQTPFNHLHNLKKLTVDGGNLGNVAICDLVNLEELTLCDSHEISSVALANLVNIVSLKIDRCRMIEEGILNYPFAINLKELRINFFCNKLVELRNLEKFEIYNRMLDCDISILNNLPKLKELKIDCCKFLNNNALGVIPTVESLSIIQCGRQFKHVSFENMIRLKDVRHLKICICYYRFLTEEVIQIWESHGKMIDVIVACGEDGSTIKFTNFNKLRLHIEKTLIEQKDNFDEE